MKIQKHTLANLLLLIFVVHSLLHQANDASAQSDTTFTYQGLLTENGSPVSAPCDLRFRLFDAAVGGNQIGISQTITNVPMSGGRFTVELDFGLNAFDNSDRWLDILYRCPAGSGSYFILSPRQPITRTPYAIQTRGIFVDSLLNVGVGTDMPLDEMHVAGDVATLRLEDTANAGGHTLIEDASATQLRISKVNNVGAVLLDINPEPTGTENALVRFFRQTDTNGIKLVQFYRGDFTTSPSATIGVDGEHSFFQNHGGNVGIGTANPTAAKLQINANSGDSDTAIDAISNTAASPTIYAKNSANNGPVLWADGTSDASLASGGIIVVGNESGGNIAIDTNEVMARNGGAATTLLLNRDGGDVAIGTASGGTSKLIVPVLEILGGSDLSEMFDVVGDADVVPGTVVVIDPHHPGQLISSSQAYDRKVAGIVSGAGGVATGMTMGQAGTIAHGKHPVALSGRVYCLVDANENAVEPGDMLTTSSIPGHAMKATDMSAAQGAVIGKAMTALGKGETGLVLVLVNLQ